MPILLILRYKYFITVTANLETPLVSWPYIYRSSRSQMFLKISVLKNFVIFTGIHVCWSLFLWMFLWEDFKIKLFYRTPLMTASVPAPCFFLKLFLKLFVQLYIICFTIWERLYISDHGIWCISKTFHFLILFLYCYQTGICSKSTI